MCKILVVEDDKVVRSFLTDALASDHEVRAAADGKDAKLAVAEYAPDVVLLDLNMPDIDGTTLVQEGVFGDSTVVVITAHADPDMKNTLMTLGVFDVLSKPCKLERIQQVVRAAEKCGNGRKPAKHRRSTELLQEAMQEFRSARVKLRAAIGLAPPTQETEST